MSRLDPALLYRSKQHDKHPACSAILRLKAADKLAGLSYTVKRTRAAWMLKLLSCGRIRPTLSAGDPSQDIALRASDTLIPLAWPIALTPQVTRNCT
jgi:hypothetical protein